MRVAKQRRAALLIDPSNILCLTDRRGRPWVTDRCGIVRADLFKSPPTQDKGLFCEVVPVDHARGLAKSRALLRAVRYADTTCIWEQPDLTTAVGDSKVTWFKHQTSPLYMPANAEVCKGLAAAGLSPRWHHERRFITWWGHANRSQWALMAVLAPAHPTPPLRGRNAYDESEQAAS